MYSVIHELVPYKRSHGKLNISESDIANFPVHQHCVVCGAEDSAKAAVEFGDKNWKSVLNLVQCDNCEHVYYLNPPSQKYLLNYYEKEWMKHGDKPVQAKIYPRTSQQDKIAKLMQDLMVTNKGTTFLDVGCGHGGLMAGLVTDGFDNVYGCEQSKERVLSTQMRFPNKIYETGYQDLSLDKKFGVIYSNHVVEHIYDPSDYFSWATQQLEADGLIVIAVPNAEYETAITQLLFLPHLQSFTPQSLLMLGKRNGFNALFWQGARFDELVCVFYRSDSNVARRKIARFQTSSQIRLFTKEELFSRLQAPWHETSTKKLINLTNHLPSMLNCQQTLRRSYVRLNCWYAYYLKMVTQLSNMFDKFGMTTLSVKTRMLLRFITRKDNQIKSLGHIRFKNSLLDNVVPRITVKDQPVVLIK